MTSLIRAVKRKQTAAFTIANFILGITSLCLIFGAANTTAYSQIADDIPNATAAASSPADWTQFNRDNMQRWNPFETVVGVNNAAGLGLKWKNPIGTYINGIQSSPAVVNGVLYFGSDDHNVYALNASSGAKLWSYTTGGPVYSSPAVADGVVYVGSFDGSVYALDAGTGARLWSFATESPVLASPTVVSGVVYVGSSSTTCCTAIQYALNASTGAKLWSYSVANATIEYSSPAVSNGIVYFSASDNNLYALNASSGAKLWSTAAGDSFNSIAVANGVVYAGGGPNMYALNASTGAKLWNFTVAKTAFRSLAVANGVVYVGASVAVGPNMYALNASTGAQLWSFTVNGGVDTAAPAVANGVVYLFSDNGILYALNAGTGAQLWSFNTVSQLTGAAVSSPTIVNGMVYIRSGTQSGGNIFAFAPGLTSADLFLRVQPSATTVHQGDVLTFAFPVWNLGPNSAFQEVLNTQVPAGTTFDYIRISGTPGLGTCTRPPYQGTGAVVCHENSSMAPNTTWTVRLTVFVTAAPGTVITENAATMSDTPDPNMANNTATVRIKVQ